MYKHTHDYFLCLVCQLAWLDGWHSTRLTRWNVTWIEAGAIARQFAWYNRRLAAGHIAWTEADAGGSRWCLGWEERMLRVINELGVSSSNCGSNRFNQVFPKY